MGKLFRVYNGEGNKPVIEFSTDVTHTDTSLISADLDLIRVIEDILQVLETKGIMTESDLPQVAQDKLQRKRNIRNG